MNLPLNKKLAQYRDSKIYPYHMPGHKQNSDWFSNPFHFDITEIDGFDNLHHPEGILKESMDKAAKIYGSDKTYYLVNGSTGGILSAISAVCTPGGKILIARNCHKSVYNGVLLNHLAAEYVYPQSLLEFRTFGGILPSEIEKMLINNDEIQAVFITSPTYEGIVSDIRLIARVVHAHGLPLIVDEAHGAHFAFGDIFPESALNLGADIVIQSLHKTLPAFTQTALLHVKSNLISYQRLEFYLSVYQTSSPSYLFMANMEMCIEYMKKERLVKLAEYAENQRIFRENLIRLRKIHFLDIDYSGNYGIFDIDTSKLVFHALKLGINGYKLSDILLEKYGLQMEMSTSCYSLGITTIHDTKEGFDRLMQALCDIEDTNPSELFYNNRLLQEKLIYPALPCRREKISEAVQGSKCLVLLLEAIGRISCEFIYAYPPGIPIIVPGEVISEEVIQLVGNYQSNGVSLQGLQDKDNQRIYVRV